MANEEEYLFIKDRMKDMYISGGENVYPAEVEYALLNVPGVVEAAVIGIPDEKWGKTGRAFVVLTDDHHASGEHVRGKHKARLAGYKIPREILVVEQLPRTTNGKLQKHVLRARP